MSSRNRSLSNPNDPDTANEDEGSDEGEDDKDMEADYDEYYKDLTTVADAQLHFPLQVSGVS